MSTYGRLHTLNLDKDFNPNYYPEIEYDSFDFAGGESHIRIKHHNFDFGSTAILTHRPKNGHDVIKILMAKDALIRYGFRSVQLVIPYLPYARQDRVCNEGEAFSLKVFCEMINSANFSRVHILDPHSDVGSALLDNVVIHSNEEYVRLAMELRINPINLVSPDVGASKKCQRLMSTGLFDGLIKCDKSRDLKTGALTGFEVLSGDVEGKDCLMVDDICDGGGTFMGLAKELKIMGAGRMFLFVTHGIFSKGLDGLGDVFEKIYCTNSFKDVTHKQITQFKIEL